MNPPDLYDAGGQLVPDRRRSHGRRDDDVLSPEILLGYERWAGVMWKHRGKIAAGIGLLGSLAGCVAGYLGRAHDLTSLRTETRRADSLVERRLAQDSVRIGRIEAIQAEQLQNEPLKMSMLCSLTRRIDPLGVPAECGSLPRHP